MRLWLVYVNSGPLDNLCLEGDGCMGLVGSCGLGFNEGLRGSGGSQFMAALLYSMILPLIH